MKPALLVLAFACASAGAVAQTLPADPTPAVAEPALRDELVRMLEADQEVRHRLIAAGVWSRLGTPEWTPADSTLLAELSAVDAAHTARLHEIVAAHGWPSSGLVGPEGVYAAFIVVQHADPETQEAMLPLVEAAYRGGDLPGQSYALLLDRVLVHRGEPQRYGTQVLPEAQWVDGEPAIFPTMDEETLDERREEVGLPPLAFYLELIKQLYAPGEAGPE